MTSTTIVMMRRRSSRRWSMTGMRPSGLAGRPRSTRGIATTARSAGRRAGQALLRRRRSGLQLRRLRAEFGERREVTLQTAALPDQLEGAETENHDGERRDADPD